MTVSEPIKSHLPPYQPLEDVQNLNYYTDGGFHPVHLEDEFCNGRYRVVHKLGYGGYSVVWLAKDQHTNRYVALKILRAAASSSSNESRILHILEEHQSQQQKCQGGQYVAKLLDEFDIEGVNGQHKCLVSELAGYSIAESKNISCVWLFPVEVARAISAKVILGVHFLHSNGIVHGDLHKANIMLKIPNVDDFTVDQLYERFGSPPKWPVVRRDGESLDGTVPSYAVPHMITSKACEDVTESEVIITDFGEAYVLGTKSRETLNTPGHLCPPEMLLRTGSMGMPADIWALACTLFEIMGTSVLFETWCLNNDEVIAEIISCLGKPPDSIWKVWENRGDFFTEDGEWALSEEHEENLDGVFLPLEKRIAGRWKRDDVSLDDEELDAFAQMLRGMLAYEQAERSTIEDVVGSEWMEKYGMPAIRALAEHTMQDQDHQMTEEASDLSSSPRTPSSPPSSATLSDENAVPEIKDLDIILPSTNFTNGLPTPRTSPTSTITPIPIIHIEDADSQIPAVEPHSETGFSSTPPGSISPPSSASSPASPTDEATAPEMEDLDISFPSADATKVQSTSPSSSAPIPSLNQSPAADIPSDPMEIDTPDRQPYAEAPNGIPIETQALDTDTPTSSKDTDTASSSKDTETELPTSAKDTGTTPSTPKRKATSPPSKRWGRRLWRLVPRRQSARRSP
ncbi:MAG: hypothetical protein Q9212_006673 [Teloschistes hypoglaucus]